MFHTHTAGSAHSFDVIVHVCPINTLSCKAASFFYALMTYMELFQYVVSHGVWDEHLSAFEYDSCFYCKFISERPISTQVFWQVFLLFSPRKRVNVLSVEIGDDIGISRNLPHYA